LEQIENKVENGQRAIDVDKRALSKIYLQPAFLICTAVLTIAAISMPRVLDMFGVILSKEPTPLLKSLDLLDEKALAPYRVKRREKIGNEMIIRELGTEDYIQLVLEDPEAAPDSVVRRCSLFITYYRHPGLVLHVPEECFAGTGHKLLAAGNVTFEIEKNASEQDNAEPYKNRDTEPYLAKVNKAKAQTRKVPAKRLVFINKSSNPWAGDTKFPIFYLFNVNGGYENSREGARFALNKNIRSKYSYFSKVEWKFFNEKSGLEIYPGEEEALAASRKLLSVVLPILEREYWPDLQKQ